MTYRMLRMNQVYPGDVIGDGRTVVESWSLGAYSASSPRLANIELDDGERITRKSWARIKIISMSPRPWESR